MKTVLITRYENTDQGTFGRLTVDDFACFTGELPWRDNQANISCIPAGVYQCVLTYSPRFSRKLYLVNGGHGRDGIRFHAANRMGDALKGFVSELNGCIALGDRIGWINGQKALILSRVALRQFESYLKGEPFILEIRYAA